MMKEIKQNDEIYDLLGRDHGETYEYPPCWDFCPNCQRTGADQCGECKSGNLGELFNARRNSEPVQTQPKDYRLDHGRKTMSKRNLDGKDLLPPRSMTTKECLPIKISRFGAHAKQGAQDPEAELELALIKEDPYVGPPFRRSPPKPSLSPFVSVKRDVPDRVMGICFQSDSIRFFETRKSYPPIWQETFREYNELMDYVNFMREKPLLTQCILESRLGSIEAPSKVKSRGFYSMINHLRNTDKPIYYSKTAHINFDDKDFSIETPSLSEIETTPDVKPDLANQNSIMTQSNRDFIGQKTPIDFQKDCQCFDKQTEISICRKDDKDYCMDDGGNQIDLLDKNRDLMEIQRKITGKNKIFN
jgi:hypothetical protein